MNIEYKKYKVDTAPPSVYYIPNFITENEELHIKKNVYSAPKPKWTSLTNRRLQDYGGVPHKNGMIAEKIPDWLQIYLTKIKDLSIFDDDKSPNHVLINEYLPGQGIFPHTDGPLFTPTICTINCLSHTVLEFNENNEQRSDVCKLLLEPRSLIILQNDMYTEYLHSISNQMYDTVTDDIVNLKNCINNYENEKVLKRNTRLSVTIRNVPKIAKLRLR